MQNSKILRGGIHTPQYNGNISATSWRVAGRDAQGYAYTYDNLDRMTEAKYFDILISQTNNPGGQPTTSSSFSTDNKFREALTYDVRGNILSLQRNGLNGGSWTSNGYTAATYGAIDNLSYAYNDKNQLNKVSDASLYNKGFGYIFYDKSRPIDFTYDANGNLITDVNKRITKIEYNYLNLPQEIQFGGSSVKLQFVYDASGVKLQKRFVYSNTLIYTIDYVNGVEYKNNVLQRLNHIEGGVTRNTDGTYAQEYVLRDHLGNTRITFKDKNNDGTIRDTDIVQINHYYPFGLNMEGNWNGFGGNNLYHYNGKGAT